MAVKTRLGDRLLESGLITRHQLDKALEKHVTTGQKLGKTLVDLGYLHPDQLMKTLCEDAGIPYMPLGDMTPAPAALATIPEPIARRYNSVPLRIENGRLLIAMADPFDMDALTSLERAAAKPIKQASGPRDDIAGLLRRAYQNVAQAHTAAAPAMERIVSDQLPGFIPTGVAARPGDSPVEENATAAKLVEEIIRRGTTL